MPDFEKLLKTDKLQDIQIDQIMICFKCSKTSLELIGRLLNNSSNLEDILQIWVGEAEGWLDDQEVLEEEDEVEEAEGVEDHVLHVLVHVLVHVWDPREGTQTPNLEPRTKKEKLCNRIKL